MKLSRKKQVKKALKGMGIAVLVLAVLITGLHFFVVYRARQILNYVVLEVSEGRYKVNAGKLRFRYHPLSINAGAVKLFPVDSVNASSFYTVTADSVSLEIAKLWPLITGDEIHLGNVHIIHPHVRVYDSDTADAPKKPLHVALSEMQDALVKSLSTFNAAQCIIEDGSIAYVQNKPNTQPFSVNHIYLHIDSLHQLSSKDTLNNSLSFAAYIKLFIDRPTISFPNPNTDVYIQNLLLDTRRKVFSINRFNLYEINSNGTTDSINLSNVHLRHFNWGRWLREGVVEIDTVQAYDGAVFFDFSDKELFAFDNNTFRKKRMNINLPLFLHNIEINKIGYGLRSGSPSGPIEIQLNGDSLAINEFALTNDKQKPLQVGNLAFKVTAYSNNSEKTDNESAFDKLIIDHNDLELKNYYRVLNADYRNKNISSITIPSLRVINFSLDELLQYKLKADRLVLDRPSLLIDIRESQKKRDADETVAMITRSLRPSLDIGQLSIRDAAIILIPKQATSGRITIEKLNTEIDARQLLQSRSVMDMISSATALSTSEFHVTGPNVDLDIARSALMTHTNGVHLDRVSGNIGSQVSLDLRGVTVIDSSERFDITRLNNIFLDRVLVDGGKITVMADKKNSLANKNRTPAFNINLLETGKFKFEYLDEHSGFEAEDIALHGRQLKIADGITSWDDIEMVSGPVRYTTATNNITALALKLKQPGYLNVTGIKIEPLNKSIVRNFSIPELTIYSDNTNTNIAPFTASKLIITRPVLDILLSKDSAINTGFKMPSFAVDEIKIAQPAITISNPDQKVKSFIVDSGTVMLSNVSSTDTAKVLMAKKLLLQLYHPLLLLDTTHYRPQEISLAASNVSLKNGKELLTGNIDSAIVRKVSLHFPDYGLRIANASAGLFNYPFSSADSISFGRFSKDASWRSNAEIIEQDAKNHKVTVYNPYVATSNDLISWDSLSFIPVLSRDSFWRSTRYQKDYNTIKTGYIEFRKWNLTEVDDKKLFSASHLLTKDFDLLTEKDKTHGTDTVSYRPLLANSLKAIPLQFDIDTVRLQNAYVKHNLLPEKSKKLATIFFSDINGEIYNLQNIQPKPHDTLGFRLQSKLMGQGNLLMGFRQSYSDTLQSFVMRAKLDNIDLSALNSLLVPLYSVRIDRGTADSMLLIVEANDHLALGSMDLRYHNLHLSILKQGEGEYFLSKFYNWLLNVVVRSHDNSRKKAVYQERLRNKTIYNYWGKIAINGLLSNLGLKGNKKQLRKYRKALRNEAEKAP